MNNISEPIVTILTAIIGVAILAVLVSRNAQTSQVLTAGSNAFSRALGTALSPIAGGGGMAMSSYGSVPQIGMGGFLS